MKKVGRYISERLQVYRDMTQKTYTEMEMDFDITISNLYLCQNERGNPRASTIDKIVSTIEENCPEAFEVVGK